MVADPTDRLALAGAVRGDSAQNEPATSRR